MQIVGASLGMFGAGLEPEAVLSRETPLRDALFDILLSLVEGGALEMRPMDDGRHAFRWRADYAVAGVSPATSKTIDMEVPSPYLAELARVKRERDDALGRADFAEGLAAERERLLRLAEVPSPSPRVAKRRVPRETNDAVAALDPEDQSVLDVLYASRAEAAESPAAEAASEAPHRDASKPGKRGRDEPRAAEPEPDIDLTVDDEDDANEVVYLAHPSALAAADAEARDNGFLDDESSRPKWSGYTLDKPRSHLSSVDSLADEG
jgi:hypothetical protein